MNVSGAELLLQEKYIVGLMAAECAELEARVKRGEAAGYGLRPAEKRVEGWARGP